MPTITQVKIDNKTGRVIVYIDNSFCASIRPSVWSEMDLREGSEVSHAELHKKESAVWRNTKNLFANPIKKAINRANHNSGFSPVVNNYIPLSMHAIAAKKPKRLSKPIEPNFSPGRLKSNK